MNVFLISGIFIIIVIIVSLLIIKHKLNCKCQSLESSRGCSCCNPDGSCKYCPCQYGCNADGSCKSPPTCSCTYGCNADGSCKSKPCACQYGCNPDGSCKSQVCSCAQGCNPDGSCKTETVPFPPYAGESGAAWEPAYFNSSGTKGVFTEKDFLKSNVAIDLEGGYPTGADPSCGSADASTWQLCGLIPSSPSSFCKNNDCGITYTDAYSYASKNASSPLCQNCGASDCNGHILLINPDNEGKVAVLAHGLFGPLAPSYDMACSTSHFNANMTQELYKSILDKFIFTVKNYATANKYLNIIVNPDSTHSILINQSAFNDAGLIKVWNNLGNVNNNGVALSSGHGFFNNGCGGITFVKQGDTPNLQTTSISKQPNNVTLNIQIDTRAWSGELTDTIEGQQSYLVTGLLGAANSRTCLQPQIMPMNPNQYESLLMTVCSGFGPNGCLNPITPTTEMCYCPTNESCGGDCLGSASDEASCDRLAVWKCKWGIPP